MSDVRDSLFSVAEVSSLLDASPEPAAIIGRDHRILATNAAYRERFALDSPAEGHYCHRVSHRYAVPCDVAGEECPLSRCVETGQPSRVVHVHHTRRGRRHEDVTISPIRDASGDIVAFIETLHVPRISDVEHGDRRLVGQSAAFHRMLELVSRVARSEAAVALIGESGTGKELVAEAIHALSARSEGAFVPVDCSGLTETLFESELFGHEKGSFTGALGRRDGLVAAACGGTLFLDEVGDIPLAQQVKLLRLLESGVYRRVGSVELLRADFRLICATHRDLPAMVDAGEFRRDLYYRISAFPIHVPALRERREDIPLLAHRLIERTSSRTPPQRLSDEALHLLMQYDFHGNVRELRNLLQRACLLADGDLILPEHLGLDLPSRHRETSSPVYSREIVPLEEMERRYLIWAEANFEGDRRQLAERLGLNVRTFYRKLRSVKGTARPSRPPSDAAAP